MPQRPVMGPLGWLGVGTRPAHRRVRAVVWLLLGILLVGGVWWCSRPSGLPYRSPTAAESALFALREPRISPESLQGVPNKPGDGAVLQSEPGLLVVAVYWNDCRGNGTVHSVRFDGSGVNVVASIRERQPCPDDGIVTVIEAEVEEVVPLEAPVYLVDRND